VTPAWSWDQTLKSLSSQEGFNTLKTISEKKQAFRDFIDELRREEKDERRMRIVRAKDNFRRLLEDTPAITGTTRWK